MNIYQRTKTLFSGINEKTFSPLHVQNRLKVMTKYLMKDVDLRSCYPTLVHVELTNICNLRCVMCSSFAMKRKRGFMDSKLFKKIIDELSDSPTETVSLYFYGESLLHKEFSEFLKIAKSAKLNIFLSTNGLVLNKKIAKAIIDNSLDLMTISCDSLDPDTYRKIRRGGDFKTLQTNIKNFLRLKGKKKPEVVLQFIKFPNYAFEPEKIRQYWQNYDVKIVMHPLHNWLGDVDEVNKMLSRKNKKENLGRCDQAWRHAVICWDGRVVSCCNFYDAQVVFGDLNKQSLKSIWEGKAAAEFRKKHTLLPRSEIKECATCDYQAPNLGEILALSLFDMQTINKVLLTTDGWRE